MEKGKTNNQKIEDIAKNWLAASSTVAFTFHYIDKRKL